MENNCGLERLDLYILEKTLTELVFKNTAKSVFLKYSKNRTSQLCVCVHVCTHPRVYVLEKTIRKYTVHQIQTVIKTNPLSTVPQEQGRGSCGG